MTLRALTSATGLRATSLHAGSLHALHAGSLHAASLHGSSHHGAWWATLIVIYVAAQLLYLGSLLVVGYFFTRRVDWITAEQVAAEDLDGAPPILLLYPVLREAEDTMRTTMLSIGAARADYLPAQVRVVALPNADDTVTIAAISRLMAEFPFLELLTVPPTTDPRWSAVWANWETNSKAYWWHVGKRSGEMALPAKKTRQLVYALYAFAARLPGEGWLLSYLDADSAVPVTYFRIAAAGVRNYDVIQLTNVAGNLLRSWASSFHSMDHMAWDGSLYPHMTARGRHPFYVLGKGLFFKVSDLVELGGFNPWLTIEDPEVGMRLWTNGKRLGVSDAPLIEEVPQTFRGGVTQRKRWVAGFFQSLHAPLTLMGMTFSQRMKARLNVVPCLALTINAVGFPIGIWAVVEAAEGHGPLDTALTVLSAVNIAAALTVLVRMFVVAYARSDLVLTSRRQRLAFMLRVNPVFMILYWGLWLAPLAIGLSMFIRDTGLTWQRTEKVDANHELVRADEQYGGAAELAPVTAGAARGVIDLTSPEFDRGPAPAVDLAEPEEARRGAG